MANIVEQIRDNFETEVSTALGATYSELKYKIDISQNNFKGNKLGYGVVPQEFEVVEGVIKSVTVDHTFDVVLTQDYHNQKSDANQVTSALELFDKMNDVSDAVVSTNLGLAGTVFVVRMTGTDEPEYLEEDNVVVLRGKFLVKYRTAIDN